jgi:hypothetical protein
MTPIVIKNRYNGVGNGNNSPAGNQVMIVIPPQT